MSTTYEIVVESLTEREVPTITVQRYTQNSSAPRILILHGLQSYKEKYLEELYLLASYGFKATSLDLYLHGARNDSAQLADLLQKDFLSTMRAIIYETAADVSALLDHWADASNGVGLYAVSAGGLIAHASTVADPRITVVAASLSSPDWSTADARRSERESLPDDAAAERLNPVDNPNKYPPTALLMIIAEDDDVVSPEGSRLLLERLKPLYASLGISTKLELVTFSETGHHYNPEMRRLSIEWMRRHLPLTPMSTAGI